MGDLSWRDGHIGTLMRWYLSALWCCLLAWGCLANVHAEDLPEAIRKGNLAAVQTKLAQEHTLGVITPQGETALHLASQYGHKRIVEFLLAHGADVHAQTAYGDTPLHYAAESSQADVAELLLTHGANLEAKNSQRWTFLPLAREGQDTELLKFLSVAGEQTSAAQNHGETPLHRAASHGNVATVHVLFAHGADVNVRSLYNGQTPLHLAAIGGSAAVVSFLLEHGAEVGLRMTLTVTPTDDVRYFLTPLHLAVLAGRTEVVQLLLAASADVNNRVQEEENARPLAPNLYAGDDNRLTELGSLANLTALHLAALCGHREIVALLCRHGADVNATDSRGRTPLHLVSLWNKQVTAAEELLRQGAKTDVQDREGKSPLQAALAKGRKAFVELYFAYGSDPKEKQKTRVETKGATLAKDGIPVRALLPTERSW